MSDLSCVCAFCGVGHHTIPRLSDYSSPSSSNCGVLGVGCLVVDVVDVNPSDRQLLQHLLL